MTDSDRTPRPRVSLEFLVRFIGSLVSIITKVGVRYVGILAQSNPIDRSIGLAKVRSYGTEGRVQGVLERPPWNKIYDLIVFQASHIVDFRVLAPPPVRNRISLPAESSGTNLATPIQNQASMSESSASNLTPPRAWFPGESSGPNLATSSQNQASMSDSSARHLTSPIQNRLWLPGESSGTTSATRIQNQVFMSESSAAHLTTPIHNRTWLPGESYSTNLATHIQNQASMYQSSATNLTATIQNRTWLLGESSGTNIGTRIQNQASMSESSATNLITPIRSQASISESFATNLTTPIQNQASLLEESAVTKQLPEAIPQEFLIKFGSVDFLPAKSRSSLSASSICASSDLKPSTETLLASAPKLSLPENPRPVSVSTASEGPTSIPTQLFGSWPVGWSSAGTDQEIDIRAPYAGAPKSSLLAVPTVSRKPSALLPSILSSLPRMSYSGSSYETITLTPYASASNFGIPAKSGGTRTLPFVESSSGPAMPSSGSSNLKTSIAAPHASASESNLPEPTLTKGPSRHPPLLERSSSVSVPTVGGGPGTLHPAISSSGPIMCSNGSFDPKTDVAAPHASAPTSCLKKPASASVPPLSQGPSIPSPILSSGPVMSYSSGCDNISAPSSKSGRGTKSVSFAIPLSSGEPSTPVSPVVSKSEEVHKKKLPKSQQSKAKPNQGGDAQNMEHGPQKATAPFQGSNEGDAGGRAEVRGGSSSTDNRQGSAQGMDKQLNNANPSGRKKGGKKHRGKGKASAK